MNTLYLTGSEEHLFSGLPDSLRNGWRVEREELSYADTLLQRKIRLETMNVADPSLRELREKAKNMTSAQDIETLVSDVDLSSLNNADYQEILYAMGPWAMGAILSGILREASSDEMVEQAAALSSMRHLLFAD